MIKYIGSKRVLLPRITAAFGALPAPGPVLDLFSGTARVGHALKGQGVAVTANDHNSYAWHLAGCHVAADADQLTDQANAALVELSQAAPVDHWFAETYSRTARFLHPDNAVRIAGMRVAVDRLAPPDHAELLPLRHVLLTAVVEAADRVDSTVGVQMAWLKAWAPRALRPVKLRLPKLLPGAGRAWCLDAVDAAAAFSEEAHPFAAAYVDPPYNQHSYLGNYHLWETLVRWDAPEVYGKACKRVDVKARRSPFNSRRKIHAAMADVLSVLQVPVIVLSFSDDGWLPRPDLERLLAPLGAVEVLEFGHDRYIGATLGVHNHEGQVVGKPGRRRNTERLYFVAPSATLARQLKQAAADAATPPTNRPTASAG